MANVINGNTFYVDTASSGSTEGSYVLGKDIQLVGVVFTSDTTGNQIAINDIKQMNDSATPAAGSAKLLVSIAAANETVFIRLADSPIRFVNGIWISAVDSNSAATLIFKKSS